MKVFRTTFGRIFHGNFWNFKCALESSSVYTLHFSSITMTSENNKYSAVNSLLMPSSNVFGMKKLDRDAFTKEIEVPTLDVPTESLKAALKVLKPCLLKMIKLLPVQGDGQVKKVLLNPILFDEKLPYLEEMLKKLSLKSVCWTKVTLSYENFSHESIFKSVLPPDTGGNVSSFSIVGHIIHLNLKPELISYKTLIGEVLLDKYPNIKTVVNKAQTIDKEYRNFEIELLAGEPNYEVTVKENGFQYVFDFSRVFWNPRLVHEHDEIVKKAVSGEIIFDVFAGVGPFSVPLAKKKCIVYANDLNPDSYKWLCHNAKLNKVSDCLTAYNLDGCEFIQTIVKDKIIQLWKESNKSSIRILMNLPASALEFLSTFNGLLKDQKFPNIDMPVVYCYFFLKKDEEAVDVIKKYFSEDTLKTVQITSVRLVAPNKRMMRLTYEIPSSVLFGTNDEFVNDPVAKRIKLSF